MTRRKRELTGLERALWRTVVQDVERLETAPKTKARPGSRPAPKASEVKAPELKAPEMPRAVAGPMVGVTGGLDRLASKLSRSGAKAGVPPKDQARQKSEPKPPQRPRVLPPSYAPPQSRPGGSAKRALEMLEDRTRRRLNRGQAEPDARIDLHGMRQRGAHEALRSFVLASRARGHRLVLVVTGKGEPVGTPARLAANEGRGVIRRAVPRWLALPDMAPHVIGYEPAARRHGGEGALYVRLKR